MSKKTEPRSDELLPDCRLIVPGIEKGSQGKSTVLSCIIDWMRWRHPELAMRVYDPDHIHRTMTRMYAAPGAPGAFRPDEPHRVIPLDLRGKEGFTRLDEVVNQLAEAPLALVDGAAQAFEEGFGAWTRSLGDFAAVQAELSFRVTYVLPVTALSLGQAKRTMLEKGLGADYLIVKRKAREENAKAVWDMEGADFAEAREIARQVGARIITIRDFWESTVQVLNPPEPSKAAQVEMTPQPTLYSIASGRELAFGDRRRTHSTWTTISQELDSVADILLPPAVAAKGGRA